MSKHDIDRIKHIVIEHKKMREWRNEACDNLRHRLNTNKLTDAQFRNEIELVFQTYHESIEIQDYIELIKSAREDKTIDVIFQQVYREEWNPELTKGLISTYQLTWDKKSTDTDSKVLRLDVTKLLLIENPETFFYQPTESTIVFDSNRSYGFWNVRFQSLINKMYFSFCEISPSSFFDEPRTDLNMESLRSEVLNRIKIDSENKIRKTVRKEINDTFRDYKELD